MKINIIENCIDLKEFVTFLNKNNVRKGEQESRIVPLAIQYAMERDLVFYPQSMTFAPEGLQGLFSL